jgi:hypothetical protein
VILANFCASRFRQSSVGFLRELGDYSSSPGHLARTYQSQKSKADCLSGVSGVALTCEYKGHTVCKRPWIW